LNRSRITAAVLLLAAFAATPLAAQGPPEMKTTEFGRGTTLVLLPGLGSQRSQWMPTARKLIGTNHVVMADLPGHGESGMPDPFSFDAAAQMLDGLLAKQNPESTIVVAHGVGGLIAVLEASRHPERMKGLIVVDGALRSPIRIPDQQKKFFTQFMDENYDAFLKQLFRPLGRDSAQSVEICAKAALVPSQNVKAYVRQLLDADASGAAKANTVPTLYVGSSLSWPDSVAWPAVAKERGWDGVANLKTRRIGNSGYLIMADQPDSLAQVIREFTSRVMSKDVASAD
jgi:N-formylmaleamate deformylase